MRPPFGFVGVGNLLDIAGDDPDAGPFMIGSDVASTNHEWPAGVADCLQRSDDGVSSASSEIMAVFKSDPIRADFSDKADCFEEEPGAFPFDAAAFRVGAADVLARRASDDDAGESPQIVAKSGCRKGANIVIDFHAWIVFGVDRTAPCLDLASRDGAEPGTMHA